MISNLFLFLEEHLDGQKELLLLLLLIRSRVNYSLVSLGELLHFGALTSWLEKCKQGVNDH